MFVVFFVFMFLSTVLSAPFRVVRAISWRVLTVVLTSTAMLVMLLMFVLVAFMLLVVMPARSFHLCRG